MALIRIIENKEIRTDWEFAAYAAPVDPLQILGPVDALRPAEGIFVGDWAGRAM